MPETERERLSAFGREQAPFLLKHFHDRVIPSMAGLPFGSKSPWKIQNMASAVQTLAELTYLEIPREQAFKAGDSLCHLCLFCVPARGLERSPLRLVVDPGLRETRSEEAATVNFTPGFGNSSIKSMDFSNG